MTLHFKYHELFAGWRSVSANTLDLGFRKQLEAADTVLMEFADKAENINVQNHFFDAQREIWLKTEDMATDFHNLIEKQLGRSPDSLSREKATPEDETLDLLNLNIYEKNLAITTLVDKSELENRQALYALRQRITTINGGKPIDVKQIPGAPKQICNIFSQCIDRLVLENDALMVLYALFDKYVLSLLPEIYEALNDRLIEMNILPSLKYEIRMASDIGIPAKAEPPPAATDSSISGEQTQSASKLGNETLTRIKDLLATNRAKTNPRKALPAGVKAANDQEIINAVSTIPENRNTALPAEVGIGQPVDKLKIDKNLLGRIEDSLDKQRKEVKSQVGRDRISDQQEDVIDVVGMLFTQILDHDGLPGIVKTLLGHLHTPYIKIGLQDRTFFSSPDHPAREFLNRGIAASISGINERDLSQGIFPLLKNIVHQIVKFRRQSPDDFTEFQNQLSIEIEQLSKKAQLLESRSQQTEKGKALLDQAKDKAQLATDNIFAGEKITPDCKQFIDEAWMDFLTLVLLRNQGNQDTADWRASQKLGRQLLDISQQAASGQTDQTSIDQLSTALTNQIGHLLPHQNKAIERFIQSLSVAEQTTDIIAAKKKPAAEPPVDQANLALYKELKKLPRNTWFQFNVDTDQSNRAKISWYNNYSDRFLFVDQAGKKICLKSISELATEVSSGETVYFPNSKRSFWDSAMSTIRQLLEKK